MGLSWLKDIELYLKKPKLYRNGRGIKGIRLQPLPWCTQWEQSTQTEIVKSRNKKYGNCILALSVPWFCRNVCGNNKHRGDIISSSVEYLKFKRFCQRDPLSWNFICAPEKFWLLWPSTENSESQIKKSQRTKCLNVSPESSHLSSEWTGEKI